ncbi:hypothetical protein FDZ58_04965 [Ehrlichia ruminantium]|uniref:Uncharacterized protein n=1 Tax=Ehrlichia ruminantium (strain Welgevonden) TaxID=254945 RepID=A0A0H3M123_EHRRW|nr:hypothetical protein FDZ68_04960 [Ehrlichia ruminantium]CAI27433.1 Hypothetical protein ERWE_CDS_09390 [Ehrlichia ruminantium str. Welgevonden]QLK51897.1 hypothetical protein FDZ66_04960 [Ehrlichia ruminantium]QLK53738.1 hypothetical protein FDZ64_04960 [Ehrlichia ruminantium]QLK55574.1 hypothetical protein FDZ62_04960 [Ehrlichia ruminantium]
MILLTSIYIYHHKKTIIQELFTHLSIKLQYITPAFIMPTNKSIYTIPLVKHHSIIIFLAI